MFVVMQVAGGLVAVAAARYWYPDVRADDIVMPHEATEAA
jgi:hypothetical protein